MSREMIGPEMQAFQAAVDDFDTAAARVLGINRTDTRCLEILLQHGEITPGILGPALGLTTGSVTAMLDRLEKLDYLTRSPDPQDRRKVVVRPTEKIITKAQELYGPFIVEGEAILSQYTDEQVDAITRFLRESRELYERQIKRAREWPAAR
ncbi:MarR family winged helix-turn-helix transcriptional regulator [Nonomuraea sp. bgisy101]|uniref:MarR family winged helix-turn-helix transcriptional regulator n=1 Tax=Nonomuraea sp. bgisy101 TaxID=3413784 RepID=UPI003D764397